MKKWHITRVDNKWVMSRAEPGGIAFRDLNFMERVVYFFQMRKHEALYPNWRKTSAYPQDSIKTWDKDLFKGTL